MCIPIQDLHPITIERLMGVMDDHGSTIFLQITAGVLILHLGVVLFMSVGICMRHIEYPESERQYRRMFVENFV